MAPRTNHQGTNQICSGGKCWRFKYTFVPRLITLPIVQPSPTPTTPAEDAHYASLGKEQSFYIAVTGADGFHDTDLATALEDCHHQRVDDSDGSNRQSQAAEDSEKQVEHGEKLTQATRGVDNRKGVETHLLDCVLDSLNLGWAFYVHFNGCVGWRTVGHVCRVAQVGRLHYVQVLRQLEREKDTRSGLATHAVGIKIATRQRSSASLLAKLPNTLYRPDCWNPKT